MTERAKLIKNMQDRDKLHAIETFILTCSNLLCFQDKMTRVYDKGKTIKH